MRSHCVGGFQPRHPESKASVDCHTGVKCRVSFRGVRGAHPRYRLRDRSPLPREVGKAHASYLGGIVSEVKPGEPAVSPLDPETSFVAVMFHDIGSVVVVSAFEDRLSWPGARLSNRGSFPTPSLAVASSARSTHNKPRAGHGGARDCTLQLRRGRANAGSPIASPMKRCRNAVKRYQPGAGRFERGVCPLHLQG
jgi:hypothetical protein